MAVEQLVTPGSVTLEGLAELNARPTLKAWEMPVPVPVNVKALANLGCKPFADVHDTGQWLNAMPSELRQMGNDLQATRRVQLHRICRAEGIEFDENDPAWITRGEIARHREARWHGDRARLARMERSAG